MKIRTLLILLAAVGSFLNVAHAEFTRQVATCHYLDTNSLGGEIRVFYTFESLVATPTVPNPRQNVYHLKFTDENGHPNGADLQVFRSTPDLDLKTADNLFSAIAFTSGDGKHQLSMVLNPAAAARAANTAKATYLNADAPATHSSSMLCSDLTNDIFQP